MAEEKKEEDKKKSEDENESQESTEALRESLLRMAAEFDNYKKRVSKEIENSEQKGKMSLAAKLLPVLDEFEIAVKNTDMTTEHGKGIAIVLSNFIDILKKEGFAEIESSGVFDPYRHEVLMTKESEEKEGTILITVRKGYMWKETMLRPASVVVSNGKGPVAEKQEKTKQ